MKILTQEDVLILMHQARANEVVPEEGRIVALCKSHENLRSKLERTERAMREAYERLGRSFETLP